MARKEIETKIETGMKTLVEAIDYVSTNSIPVEGWKDIEDEKFSTLIQVHVNPVAPAVPEVPDCGAWKSRVDLICRTKIKADQSKAILDRLYEECLGLRAQLAADPSALTTAAGTTIDGVRSEEEANEETVSDMFQIKVCKFNIFTQE